MSSSEEEVLEAGRDRRGPWSGLLGLVLTFALVIAGGVWLATSGSSPTPTHATSAAPSETLTLPAFATATPPPPRDFVDPTKCPEDVACDSDRSIPTHLLAVLHQYVPRARGQSGYTVFRRGANADTDDGLWYRQLNARTRKIAIVIIISRSPPGGGPPSEIDDTVDGFSFGFVRLRVEGYQVQVQADGERGDRPTLATLEQLAADPRLETLP